MTPATYGMWLVFPATDAPRLLQQAGALLIPLQGAMGPCLLKNEKWAVYPLFLAQWDIFLDEWQTVSTTSLGAYSLDQVLKSSFVNVNKRSLAEQFSEYCDMLSAKEGAAEAISFLFYGMFPGSA